MLYENVVKLFKELSVPGVEALPRELPAVSFDVEETHVTLTDKPPGMSLSANLGLLEPENPAEAYSKILMGNFLGLATKRAALGLDETGKNLLLSASVPTVRSYREFRDIVEDFVNTVVFWKKELSIK